MFPKTHPSERSSELNHKFSGLSSISSSSQGEKTTVSSHPSLLWKSLQVKNPFTLIYLGGKIKRLKWPVIISDEINHQNTGSSENCLPAVSEVKGESLRKGR